MAVKKTTKKKDESAAPTKVEAKETAPKTTTKPKTAAKAAAPKKSAAAPAPTPPAPEPAAATKPKTAPKAAAKAAAPKKAVPAPIKLTDPQGELLKKIGATAETGYLGEKKEERSIESLLTKKLIKKGAKDKASGKLRYHISTAGKKHIS